MEVFLAIVTVSAIACVGILSPGPDFVAVSCASALSSAAPASAGWPLLAAMLVAVVVVATVWFTFVVSMLTRPGPAAAFRHFKVYFESLFGVLLVAFGLRQLFARTA
jgi:threonine/homoserine/homoserine lactone efflux protein